MNLQIDLACNDHRNGTFQGWFDHAHVGLEGGDYDDGMELDGPRTRVSESVATQAGKRYDFVKIGRITCRVLSSRTWYGNWCWESYTVEMASGIQVLNYLKGRGFSCNCGPTGLFEVFNGDGQITAATWAWLEADIQGR